MKTIQHKRLVSRTVIILIAIVLLTGCRSPSPPVKFYTLNPVIESSEGQADANVRQNLAVGVGPIEIPRNIDRPQMVTRTAPNTLRMDEFHRWAGSLREDSLSSVTANLAVLLKTQHVTAYPWDNYFRPDYRIFLDIHRFDGKPGDHIVLDVTCTITDGEATRVLFIHKSRIEEAVSEKDFGALINAQNKTLAILSRELAQIIIKLEAGTI